MEFIERQNVLDLIGRDAQRYHSCIITCYSFDFTYFEERILPVFRTSNIRNVNVFVDGFSLETSQEMLTGKEFSFQKNYSVIPIYNDKGIFHPKLILLTGYHEGLLVIGSGNITSSGLNNNDEVWGAFHFKEGSENNAKIFYEVWMYLESYFPQAFGMCKEKLQWFTNNSPWISNLHSLISTQSKSPILITGSFYKTILSKIPKNNLLEINIISPYFDRKGVVIHNLQRDFNPKIINVLVDKSGILPSAFPFDNYKNVKFFDWKDAKSDFNADFHRLHAKIIHFKYADKEFLLLGSANATLPAFGDEKNNGINSEVSLLIERENSDKNWLEQLRINIPKKTIDLDIIKNFKRNIYFLESKAGYRNSILYAEHLSDNIIIYTKHTIAESDLIIAIDRYGINKSAFGYTKVDDTIYSFNTQESDIFKLFIERDGVRISNFSLIHNAMNLLKTNPNQLNAELDALLSSDFSNGSGLTALLKYVETDWADEKSLQVKGSFHSSVMKAVPDDKNEIEKEYEILEYEDFNRKDLNSFYKNYAIFQNPNLKIADFFIALAKGLEDRNQFLESEELKLLIDDEIENGGSGNDLQTKTIDFDNAIKESVLIKSYLTKLYKFLKSKVDPFFYKEKYHDLSKLQQELVSITIFSKLLIALELINTYRNERFKGRRYIIEGSIDDYFNIKGFLIQTIGLAFLVYQKGFTRYENKYLVKKFEFYKELFSIKILELVCDIFWKKSEREYVSILILNMIKYTGDKNIIDSFCSLANEKFEDSKDIIEKYDQWEKLYNNMQDRKSYLIYDISPNLQGEIIFNSKLGFGIIQSANKDGIVIAKFQTGELTIKLGQKCVLFRIKDSHKD